MKLIGRRKDKNGEQREEVEESKRVRTNTWGRHAMCARQTRDLGLEPRTRAQFSEKIRRVRCVFTLWEGRCWPKGQTPHSRKRTGGLTGETNEECEERVEERSNTQAHDTWMVRRALTPWANVVWDITDVWGYSVHMFWLFWLLVLVGCRVGCWLCVKVVCRVLLLCVVWCCCGVVVCMVNYSFKIIIVRGVWP